MPIYEYKCKECEKISELLQKVDDPPPLCPKCNIKMERVISKGSFLLKGTGWSPDGYAKKGKKNGI